MKRLSSLFVLVSVLFLSGCSSTFYHQRYPLLEMPNRPVLTNVPVSEVSKMSQKAQETVTDNFDKLIGYCRKLEAAINGYNEFATKENETLKSGVTK